jgi:hypothetical protein
MHPTGEGFRNMERCRGSPITLGRQASPADRALASGDEYGNRPRLTQAIIRSTARPRAAHRLAGDLALNGFAYAHHPSNRLVRQPVFPPSAQANQRMRNVGESGGNRAELWPQSAKIGRSFRAWRPEVRKGTGRAKALGPASASPDAMN